MRHPNAGRAASPTRCSGVPALRWTPSFARTAGSSPGLTSEPRSQGPCCARGGYFMPHDAARLADTKAWFDKAWIDLRAADVDLAAEPPVLEDLLFHCQQAV